MNPKLSDWASIAEIIGAVAIVISLVFVGLEIRNGAQQTEQNTDAIRASAIQDVSRWSFDAAMILVENEDLRSARSALCAGTATPEQSAQIDVFYGGLLRLQANRYYQSRVGFIDADTLLGLGGKGLAYRVPFFRDIWERRKIEFDSGFVEFVERELLPLVEDSC